jgi:hypothetical protein
VSSNYPFKAPLIIFPLRNLLPTIYSTIGGSMVRNKAALKRPIFVIDELNSLLNALTATVAGYLDTLDKNIKGIRNSLKDQDIIKTEILAIAGIDRGKYILLKQIKFVAPSIVADSIIAFGRLSKKFLSINTLIER